MPALEVGQLLWKWVPDFRYVFNRLRDAKIFGYPPPKSAELL
jgi:hypothetical protein